MPEPVYILGGHQTDFARTWSREGQDISDMVRTAAQGALAESAIDPSEIQSIHVGNAFAELQRQQAHLGSMVAQVMPELWGVPAMRHEGACASSSLAALAAMAEIEAGRYECALVLGVEELKNLPGDVSSQNQNAAAWQGHEDIQCRFMWPAVFGRLAAEYERRYGLDRRHLNRIAELNYTNAKRNANAQTRRWQFNELSFTDDDNANPVIEPGIRRQDAVGLIERSVDRHDRRSVRKFRNLDVAARRTITLGVGHQLPVVRDRGRKNMAMTGGRRQRQLRGRGAGPVAHPRFKRTASASRVIHDRTVRAPHRADIRAAMSQSCRGSAAGVPNPEIAFSDTRDARTVRREVEIFERGEVAWHGAPGRDPGERRSHVGARDRVHERTGRTDCDCELRRRDIADDRLVGSGDRLTRAVKGDGVDLGGA